MRLALLSALNGERAARRACALVTPLDGGEQRLFLADNITGDALPAALEKRLRAGKSGVVEHEGRRFFINVQTPSARLIVIGAVHVTQALAPMAQLAGFDVVIVDPRTAFAATARFPNARLISQWPDAALAAIGLDAFTAVAALTHDPKIDDLALRLALESDCFYIGALGSKKTHARRVERLAGSGVRAEALARLHAPIGLDIGAESPAEIAVSVLGEMILTLRKSHREETKRERSSAPNRASAPGTLSLANQRAPA